MTRFALLAAALLLSACAQKTAAVAPPAAADWPPPHNMTEAECKVAGGGWGPVGLMGTPACTIKSPDAGKVCSDSSECAGDCWSQEVGAAGTKGTGFCQPTNMPFGCHSEVKGGILQPALCAD